MKDSMMRNNGVKERIYITDSELEIIENRLSVEAHVQRYGFVRQYVHDHVLDCACGCGYGTYMLSKNPDVKSIIGVDRSKEAIDFAMDNYCDKKTFFTHCENIEDFEVECIDQLVSIETIEHLKDPMTLIEMAIRNEVPELIISFPTKKSTHYNKFHYHDFTFNDIKEMLVGYYKVKDSFEYKREVGFVFAKKI